MDFSLFYFAHDGAAGTGRRPADLLLESARFVDRHGFTAVWTPERHFHPFGGIRPTPAVTAAAIAAVTDHVEIRAGSVIGPGYDATRFAEEWSVVDNLSAGRVALSFGPGWPSEDFVIAVEDYVQRREVLLQTIDDVRRRWREDNRLHPAPVRPEVPVWLTSAGSAGTFAEAGQLGAGLLTHLLCQDLDELAKTIGVYREAYTGTSEPRVALMLPTFLGHDADVVRRTVRAPFMRTDAGRLLRAPGDVLRGVDTEDLDPEDLEFLVENAFDRYVATGGLFGSLDDAAQLLDRVAEAGVDEVTCMIDVDVAADAVLTSLDQLAALKDAWQSSKRSAA